MIKTNYIVGHYIQYYVSRDFHVDFTYDDLESAFNAWRHLCSELPAETNVEIRKQTTEVVVSKENIPEVLQQHTEAIFERKYQTNIEYDLERWRVHDQS